MAISFRQCAVTLRTRQFPELKRRWMAYYTTPSTCRECRCTLDWFKRKCVFCSSACAATHNNKLRYPMSPSTKLKISTTAKLVTANRLIKYREKYPLYTKVIFGVCPVCNSGFIWNSITKGYKHVCSKKCYLLSASHRMSVRLRDPDYRKNYGRGKPSYLERSFKQWLIDHNVEFEEEVRFKNEHDSKTYFADFAFHSQKLIIELDGSQHKRTLAADAIRDEYITEHYGYVVLRISHAEYQSKAKYAAVCELLGI